MTLQIVKFEKIPEVSVCLCVCVCVCERVSPQPSYHNPAALPNQWPLCGGGTGTTCAGEGWEAASWAPGAPDPS